MKKLPFLKILSLLTAILILCALMAACNSDGADADRSDSTDSSNDTAPSINVDGLLVFGNEEYACSVIRSEMPSSVDGNTYNEIRKILKTATGKNCSIKTDFVGMGETLDKDIPAILVGDTDYPESKQVYEKLAHGEYRKINGNRHKRYKWIGEEIHSVEWGMHKEHRVHVIRRLIGNEHPKEKIAVKSCDKHSYYRVYDMA